MHDMNKKAMRTRIHFPNQIISLSHYAIFVECIFACCLEGPWFCQNIESWCLTFSSVCRKTANSQLSMCILALKMMH